MWTSNAEHRVRDCLHFFWVVEPAVEQNISATQITCPAGSRHKKQVCTHGYPFDKLICIQSPHYQLRVWRQDLMLALNFFFWLLNIPLLMFHSLQMLLENGAEWRQAWRCGDRLYLFPFCSAEHSGGRAFRLCSGCEVSAFALSCTCHERCVDEPSNAMNLLSFSSNLMTKNQPKKIF